MNRQEILDHIRYKLTASVPLIGHTGLDIVEWESGRVVIEAPLAPNINTHGTAFGGSLYLVASMAGWSMIHLTLLEAGCTPSVWIVKGEIAYSRPVRGTLRAIATLEEEDRSSLVDQFRVLGKARMGVKIVVQEDGKDCVTLTAQFAAVTSDPA